MQGRPTIKVGCCGFAGGQKHYFDTFSLIEVQKTFYQLPQLKTAERWKEMAPEGFEFLIKAWQLITHEPTSPTYRRLSEKIPPDRAGDYGRFQSTQAVFDAWRRTAEWALVIGATHVVFQCPARFRPTPDNLRNLREFFQRIDRHRLTLVWEPRGAWPDETIRALCEELSLIHGVDPFRSSPVYGEHQYFRLHGPQGYASQHTDDHLRKLRNWCQGKVSYVLFNNQTMKEDALRFKTQAGEAPDSVSNKS